VQRRQRPGADIPDGAGRLHRAAGGRRDRTGLGPMSLIVVGLDGAALPPGAVAALAGAQVVVGAPHQLEAGTGPCWSVVLGPTELARLDPASSVVVLASGDPGFFGIVRALRKRGLRPTVLPARSSVARAFALLRRSWDDVAVVSAHGRSLR